MKAADKGIGIAAVIMAVCCAVLPLAGGAIAGGLAFGTGALGIAAGLVLFTATLLYVLRRRKDPNRC